MTRRRPSSPSARRPARPSAKAPAKPTTRKRSPRKPPARNPRTARASRRAPRPIVTVVLFDLDDTLYDCFGQRVVAAHRNASHALAAAGLPASADQILKLRLAAMEADPRQEFVDLEVSRQLGVPLSDTLRETSQAAYFSTPVGRLHLFPGALALLRYLKRRGVRNFIVSFGDPQTQRAKVAALGLEGEPAVENIFYADLAQLLSKEDFFRSILHAVESDPARVLVVGDRPASEIRAGKGLGMRTVRLRHGEFSRQEPEGEAERADFEIRKIAALRKLPFHFGPRR
ncbi:MAG: HAD hydrolase-like protein [Acidobacteriota bacterium]|nr:HAD hydrolase-like protein [Acidobacteriota bacterium]